MATQISASSVLFLSLMLMSYSDWKDLLMEISSGISCYNGILCNGLSVYNESCVSATPGKATERLGFIAYDLPRKRQVTMVTAFLASAQTTDSKYQQHGTGASNTPWMQDPDTASSSSPSDPDSTSTGWTDDPDTSTIRPINDYSQTIMVIGITVAFALTLAIGGSIAAGICRADNKPVVNPEARRREIEVRNTYVQQLHHFALQIPTTDYSKPSTQTRKHELFTSVHSADISRTLTPVQGYPASVTSLKTGDHVIGVKRHQKRYGRGGQSKALVIQLSDPRSNGDCLTTARDIVIEEI